MITEKTQAIIDKAKQIYGPMRQELEAAHHGSYIAIEPESGDTFISDTFDGAVRSAREFYPNRITHTIRIGHQAAFHIGLMVQ